MRDGRDTPDGPPEGQVQPAATKVKKSFNEAAHKLPVRGASRGGGQTDDAADHENLDTAGHSDRKAAVAAASADGDQGDVIAHAGRAVLALGALGVVYGDLGTSPLYTEQVTFGFKATQHVAVAGVYGVVSLIFWALAIVVTTKYAGFIMRAHNRGDGGIMALAALCRRLKVPRIRVGFPIHDRVGGQRVLHLGYRGAQELFDRIVNALLEVKQETSTVGYAYL